MNGSPTNAPAVKTQNIARLVEVVCLIALCLLPGVLLGSLIANRASIWVGSFGAVIGGCWAYVLTLLARRSSTNTRTSSGTPATSPTGLEGKRRWGPSATLIALAASVLPAIFAGVVVVVNWPTGRDQSVFASMADAIVHGWSDLVRSPFPTFAEPRTLVPLVFVTTIAAALSTSVAVATHSRLLPILPPVAAFLFAAIAAGRHQFAATAAGTALVLLSGLVLWLRTIAFDDDHNLVSSTRPATASPTERANNRIGFEAVNLGAVVVIASIGALMLGPSLAFGRDKKPFDPREYLVPPSLPKNVSNPLELVGSRRQSKRQLMFTVRSNQPLVPQDLRLVTLDTFDGAAWTTNAQYERVGTVLEPSTRRDVPITAITADVVISELDSPWLLSISDVTAVSGVRVLADPSSSSLVVDEPVSSGAQYRLTGTRAEPPVESLLLLPVGSNAEARAAQLVPPGLPPLLNTMARTAIGNVERPFERAVELRNYLRSTFTVSPSKAGGFSYGHLENAFTKQGQATEEQFAAMFATLGRIVGLPTRVVVGFVPGPADTNGLVKVYSSDARVWAEVLFENVGWLPFVATPTTDGASSAAIGFGSGEKVELQKAPPEVPVPGPATQPSPLPSPIFGAGNGPSSTNPILKVVAAFVTSLGVTALAVVFLKRRKTMHRRHGSPRESVLGAWHDVLDRLRESGVQSTENLTVDELIRGTESTSAALAGLHRPVNNALYSSADITEADQTQAWRARDRFVSSLNRQSTWHKRVRCAIDPRPLVVAFARKSEVLRIHGPAEASDRRTK
jgi:transglutaminase-like putative cysteine protease